jgi:hypothetical protein
MVRAAVAHRPATPEPCAGIRTGAVRQVVAYRDGGKYFLDEYVSVQN